MMQQIEIRVPSAATDGKTVYLPLKDKVRVIGALAIPQGATDSGVVTIGKGDNAVLTTAADIGSKSAGDVIPFTLDSTSTEAQLNQIFGPDEPIQIKSVTNGTNSFIIQLIVDPFLIGKHTGLATA